MLFPIIQKMIVVELMHDGDLKDYVSNMRPEYVILLLLVSYLMV